MKVFSKKVMYVRPVSYKRISSTERLVIIERHKENELNGIHSTVWNLPEANYLTESREQ